MGYGILLVVLLLFIGAIIGALLHSRFGKKEARRAYKICKDREELADSRIQLAQIKEEKCEELVKIAERRMQSAEEKESVCEELLRVAKESEKALGEKCKIAEAELPDYKWKLAAALRKLAKAVKEKDLNVNAFARALKAVADGDLTLKGDGYDFS